MLAPPSPAMPRAARTAFALLVGVLILALLLRWLGTAHIAEQLRAADRTLLLAAALIFLTQFLTMWFRWWLVLRLLGIRVAPLSIFRANAASNFVNFFAPGHFGEPLLAAWLGRTARAPAVEAFTVLVACKLVATILSFALLIACVPLLASRGNHGWLMEVAGAGAALAGGTVLALTLALRPGVATLAARLFARASRGTVGALTPAAGEALATRGEAAIVRARDTLLRFGQRPLALVAAAGISATKIGLQIGFVMLLFAAFGQEVGVTGATFLVTVDVLQNLISVWIPANLGVQEALLVAAASGGLAIDPGLAASAAIAQKAILLLHITIGGIAFWALRHWDHAPAPPSAPAAD